MTKVFFVSILLRVLGASMVWFKGNAKALFGIEHGVFFWWLTIGLLVEFAFLESWWLLSSEIGPYKASVTLASTGTLVTVCLMCFFYGFNLRYVLAMGLIFSAGLLMRL